MRMTLERIARGGARTWIVGVLLAGGAAEGCAGMAGVVRTRASREFRCDMASTQVEELSENAYRATACGHEATYICSHQESTFSWSGQDTVCTREASAAPPTIVINNNAAPGAAR